MELGGLLQTDESVSDKLERSNAQVQTSVQKQLSESAKLVADVTQRLAKLDETNKRVVDVATDLKTLQNVLQNPKQRGVFGEFIWKACWIMFASQAVSNAISFQGR